jgi:hypothetical protein
MTESARKPTASGDPITAVSQAEARGDELTSNTIAKMVSIAQLLRATLPAPAPHDSGRE